MKLFIYGTLKRGGRLNGHLQGQKFLGETKTVGKYQLLKIGWYPGLVQSENGNQIEGELWEVTDDCLQRLDVVEGAPDLFRRDNVEIENQENIQSYFYNGDVSGFSDAGNSWIVGAE